MSLRIFSASKPKLLSWLYNVNLVEHILRDVLQSSQRKFVPLVLDQIINLKIVQTWCLAVVNLALKLESKLETRAFPHFRSERDMAPKLFCDLLGDH